jgi:hypothetical protein
MRKTVVKKLKKQFLAMSNDDQSSDVLIEEGIHDFRGMKKHYIRGKPSEGKPRLTPSDHREMRFSAMLFARKKKESK